LQSADFYSVFELYKERYLQQARPGAGGNALDLFATWLKGNSSLPQVKIMRVKENRIEPGKLLAEVALQAKNILSGKGISISCVSLGLKESSKCISVFKNNTIYYRICKTSPRKGPYKGVDLLVMELIMDGNKNNIFIPLMDRKEVMERQIGMEIQRESEKVEVSGKYRLKLLFSLDHTSAAGLSHRFGAILADFIMVTRNELLKLGVY